MKKILSIGCAALVASSLMVTSCASSPKGDKPAKEKSAKKGKKDKVTKIDFIKMVEEGNYDAALAYLTDKNMNKKGEFEPSNEYIRDALDMALVSHLKKDYDASAKSFEDADARMKDALTKSITKAAGGAALNENIAEYAGKSYEYIYLNALNALNYYSKGDVEGAGVEVRKLNDKKQQFLAKYGELALKEEDEKKGDDGAKLEKASQLLGINLDIFKKPAKPSKSDLFQDSAFARYMSAMFYLMDGDTDNAAIDAKDLAILNKEFSIKDDVAAVNSANGRLNVLALTNMIGRRDEQRRSSAEAKDGKCGVVLGGVEINVPGVGPVTIPEFDIEIAYPKFATAESPIEKLDYAWPLAFSSKFCIKPAQKEVLPLAPAAVAAVKVTVGEQSVELPVLENMSKSVEHDVNLDARKAYTRSMVRTIIKKAAGVTAGAVGMYAAQQVYQQSGVALAYTGAYIGLAKAIDAIDLSESADIRQAYALPGEVRAGGLTVAPGEYEVKVAYLDKDGNAVCEDTIPGVKVEAGKPTLVEAVCTK